MSHSNLLPKVAPFLHGLLTTFSTLGRTHENGISCTNGVRPWQVAYAKELALVSACRHKRADAHHKKAAGRSRTRAAKKRCSRIRTVACSRHDCDVNERADNLGGSRYSAEWSCWRVLSRASCGPGMVCYTLGERLTRWVFCVRDQLVTCFTFNNLVPLRHYSHLQPMYGSPILSTCFEQRVPPIFVGVLTCPFFFIRAC